MSSKGASHPRARAEQEALNLTPSQVATTVYSDSSQGARSKIDDGDDRMSRASMYTYASSDASRFRKEEDGRTWNVLNQGYFMPTDDEEWTRLNKQHVALVLGLGGLYPAQEVVRAVLAPQAGEIEPKRILDVGCGSGVWTIAMAKEFPAARVIGVDLAPTPVDMDGLPSNCTFEIDDINPGLLHYEGKFDVVHCRIIGAGLHDCRRSKRDLQACLKPGGILIWMDVDYDLHAENMEDFVQRASDGRQGGSWPARMLHEMTQAVLSIRGNDVKATGDMLDEGFWDDALMHPATCHTGSLYIPVGPWVGDPTPEQMQRLRYMGSLLRQSISNGMWTFHPILKKVGIPEATLKAWSTHGDEEMTQQTTRTWSRWMLAWGCRRGPDGSPAPVVVPADSGNWHQLDPYPYFILYDLPEKAMADLKARRKRREEIPSPSLPFS